MNSNYQYLIEQAKKHGISFLLLLFAIWHMNNKLSDIEHKYDDAILTQINYLREDRVTMQQVIQNNTEVMERVAEILTPETKKK